MGHGSSSWPVRTKIAEPIEAAQPKSHQDILRLTETLRPRFRRPADCAQRPVPDHIRDLRELQAAELRDDLDGVVDPAEHDLCHEGPEEHVDDVDCEAVEGRLLEDLCVCKCN